MRQALVTGAAGGIGRACVAALEAAGFVVWQADIQGGCPLLLDVSREEDWQRLEGELPELDAVVHCAGIAAGSPIAGTSLAEWRRVMAVNLDGSFLAVRFGMRKLREGGAMVLLGSASGTKAAAGAAGYSTSKAAMRMLVKVAALEAKARKVRVNLVSPAGVVTPLWEGMEFFEQLKAEKGEEAAWEAVGGRDARKHALERMAFPEEIAKAVLFLVGDGSAGMTGAEMVVDAGYTL